MKVAWSREDSVRSRAAPGSTTQRGELSCRDVSFVLGSGGAEIERATCPEDSESASAAFVIRMPRQQRARSLMFVLRSLWQSRRRWCAQIVRWRTQTHQQSRRWTRTFHPRARVPETSAVSPSSAPRRTTSALVFARQASVVQSALSLSQCSLAHKQDHLAFRRSRRARQDSAAADSATRRRDTTWSVQARGECVGKHGERTSSVPQDPAQDRVRG